MPGGRSPDTGLAPRRTPRSPRACPLRARRRGTAAAPLRRRCLSLHRYEVEACDATELVLALHAKRRSLFRGKHVSGGLQLGSKGRFADRRSHDVAGEREMSAFELIILVVDQRLQRFYLTAIA